MKHLARALSALFIIAGALVMAPLASAQEPELVTWDERVWYDSASWLFADPFGTPPASGVAHDYDASFRGQRLILSEGNAEDEAIGQNMRWWNDNVAPLDEYTYAIGGTDTVVGGTYDPDGANRPIWHTQSFIYRIGPEGETYTCQFHDAVWASKCPPDHWCTAPPRKIVSREAPACG